MPAPGRWRAPLRASRTRTVDVRGRRYHLREWGRPGAQPILFLHGGRDASATFQFLVDAMTGDRHCIAPDWRGHGESDWTPGSYWLSDFMGDLDRLSEMLFAGRAVSVVGHSMGANVAGMFAGIRPDRVSRLVLLDAIGNMLDLSPVPVVDTLLRFLDSLAPDVRVRAYPTIAAMADRLRAANVRLTEVQAEFLAVHLSRPLSGGGYAWARDPAFQRSFPTLHDAAEWGACWARITAPALCLFSSDPRDHSVTGDPVEMCSRIRHFRAVTTATVPDTGHNLHHDAPEAVAGAIERFLNATGQ